MTKRTAERICHRLRLDVSERSAMTTKFVSGTAAGHREQIIWFMKQRNDGDCALPSMSTNALTVFR
jgi:hypothetical protein